MNNKINPPPPFSTPKDMPWKEIEAINDGLINVATRLNTLITLLGGIPPGGDGGSGGGGTGGGGSGGGGGTGGNGTPTPVQMVLKAGAFKSIMHYAFSQLPIGIYYSDPIDWRQGARLLIKIESLLDQAVILQPSGNYTNAQDKAAPIGAPINLPARGNTTIGFAWDDWHPYIWLVVGVAVAPAQGSLDVVYLIQS